MRFLSGVSLFENLSPGALRTLAERGAELGFHRGDIVCRKGDPGQSMFIITSGIFEVFVEGEGEAQVLAHLRKGDYFGEMALLTGLPRSASVRSLAETRVFGLTRADFEDVLRSNVDIALDIIKTLSLRLAHSNVAATERGAAKVFVLLSMEPNLGRTTFAANLAAALAAQGAGRVALYDPNVASTAQAKLFGMADTFDIASTLVTTGRLDVAAVAREVRPGLLVLPPQRAGGPQLQEFQYHIPFQALRDHADVVVVDSSSTMAGLNREVIKSAEAVLLMVPATSPDPKAVLGQVERMILGPANVDASKVHLMLVQRAGDGAPTVPAGLAGQTVVVPPAPGTVQERPIVVDSDGATPFAAAVTGLARRLISGHVVELWVPVTATLDADRAKDVLHEARNRCPELLHDSRASQEPPPTIAPLPGVDVYMVLYGACSVEELRARMARLVETATDIKERLSLKRLYLRVDGRVDSM